MDDEYVTLDDLYSAYVDCRKHKSNKHGAKKFEVCAMYNLKQLIKEINGRRYTLRPAQCFIVKYPTTREVFCCDFRDRVVQHFVFNELNPIIEPLLIYDAANCRKGKGTDFAIQRASRFLRQSTDNYSIDSYILKMDLTGFFMRIDRDRIYDIIIDIIDKHYKGRYVNTLKYLVNIIIFTDITKNVRRLSPKSDWDNLPARKTLFNNPNGLPIGNICSQLFANVYLNELDHIIKSRERFYSRYVDDMLVVNTDIKSLIDTLSITNEYLPSINMKLNDKKTRIIPSKYGVLYLGIIIKPFYNTLSDTRINRMYYTGYLVDSEDKARKSAGSRKGMILRYHGKRVYIRWFNRLPYNDNLTLDEKLNIKLICNE